MRGQIAASGLSLAACVLMLCLTAGAVSYQDAMEQEGASVRQVDANLVRRDRESNAASNPPSEARDRFQYEVAAGQGGRWQGAVAYEVSGLEKLQMRIYTSRGTCLERNLNGDLTLDFTAGSSPWEQAMYSPADGRIYGWDSRDSAWVVLESGVGGSSMTPAPGVDSSQLIRYGVNVYVSGQTLSKRALTLTPAGTNLEFFAQGQPVRGETFVCTDIPAGAQKLWIELNDVSESFFPDGLIQTSLAWVEMEGAGLTFGPQPSGGKEESSSSEESSSQSSGSRDSGGGGSTRSSSSSTSASSSPASSSVSQSSGSSTVQEPSSKFQGVITSSEPSGGSASKWAGPDDARSVETATLPEDSPEAEQQQAVAQPVIYEIVRQADGESTPLPMILYIGALAALTLYLLLRPRKPDSPEGEQRR